MLEDIIRAFVQSQFGDVKRRTTGAVLEAAGLGMVGLATVFLAIGMFLWLASLIEAWQAALVVAAAALLNAAILMLVGRSMLRRRESRKQNDLMSGLDALSALTRPDPKGNGSRDDAEEPGVAIVGAALAAGVLLGRSVKR